MSENPTPGERPVPEKDRTPAEDEIDLIDLIAVIWRYRVVIVLVTVLAVAAGGVSVFLGRAQGEPDDAVTRYTSERLLYFDPIAREPNAASGEALTGNYRRVSQRILEGIVARADSGEPVEGLEEDLRSPVAEATIEADDDDRFLLAISATVDDRQQAIAAVESLVALLTTQLEQAGLTRADGSRAFEVIESPVTAFTPDPAGNNGTRPAVVVVVAGFAGLFFSIFLAFVLNYIRQVRRDPEAMRKLRGEK